MKTLFPEFDRSQYRVLIACEFSGTVRDAFLNVGFTRAVSCDLLPSELPGPHITGDVTGLLSDPWDLVIAHPPCRFLSQAAMKHWDQPGRDVLRHQARQFFLRCLNANAPMVAVENPKIPTTRLELPRPSQEIQPWMFGHPYTKRTWFWLSGLPTLTPSCPQPPAWTLRQYTDAFRSPTDRARTFDGVAYAMAIQWGNALALNTPRGAI